MKRIADASGDSLMEFVKEAIEPTAVVVHTDGWTGYDPLLPGKGYPHDITFLKGQKKSATELMPRVHRIASLLKRWILGTQQGAVSQRAPGILLPSMNSPFGSTGDGQQIGGSFSTDLYSEAVAIEARHHTNPWSNAPLPPSRPTTTCRGYLSEVNTHAFTGIREGEGVLHLP